MHIVDINDPTNPMFAGCYDDTRVHDAHCVIYDGPDTRFTGRELCITSTGGGQSVGVVDVTDKANPVTLSMTPYPNSGFSHQGWLLDGHRYFLHNTESTSRMPQGVAIFDLADLTAPQHIGSSTTLREVAFFDVYPPNDDPGFGFGTWSNYPWFSDGVVAVHGYQGLFLVKPRVGERD
jgi:hypothetical protein